MKRQVAPTGRSWSLGPSVMGERAAEASLGATDTTIHPIGMGEAHVQLT